MSANLIDKNLLSIVCFALKFPWEAGSQIECTTEKQISSVPSPIVPLCDVDAKLTLQTFSASAMVITETRSRGLCASKPPRSLSTNLLPYVIRV